MIKANSLLYAIYICLIISIFCGAILYFSTLYNQLNIFYNTHEELFVHNYSSVNYAIQGKLSSDRIPDFEESNIKGEYISKQYGAVKLTIVKSYIEDDTISSAHLAGSFKQDGVAIYLSNFSKPLSYSGKLKIVGDNILPGIEISGKNIDGESNDIQLIGNNYVSESGLPKLDEKFKKIFERYSYESKTFSEMYNENDSIIFNSFFDETVEINLSKTVVANIVCKGNIIIRSKDSLRIKKSAKLQDVILIAPKITFEEGFSGSVQAYATTVIEAEKAVALQYPSILCLYNESSTESMIKIGQNCKISGAVIMFGNALNNVDKNSIEIEKGGVLHADIYCTGKLMVKSDVNGTIYTNRFFYKTISSNYDNLISGIEINLKKRPAYFVPIALFNEKLENHGIIKRVF